MENQAKQYYITREQYLTLKATWASRSDHEAWEIIIYNILRSKPIDHGFSKKKNIQCNDPWFGFNSALRAAENYCPTAKCPWKEGSPSAIRWAIGHTNNLAHAKRMFGIDMPEDLMTKMEGQRK